MRITYLTALLLGGYIVGPSVLAEEHRHHGPHEHGSGQLNVALEKNTLEIELSMPAMNIVGFEYLPNNPDERSQVQQAADKLRDGQRIFAPSAAARCTLFTADVKSKLLGNSDDEEDGGHDGGEHADFDLSYTFNCSEPSQLVSLNLALFELFPGTKHLHAQVITPDGQSADELNSEHSTLRLK